MFVRHGAALCVHTSRASELTLVRRRRTSSGIQSAGERSLAWGTKPIAYATHVSSRTVWTVARHVRRQRRRAQASQGSGRSAEPPPAVSITGYPMAHGTRRNRTTGDTPTALLASYEAPARPHRAQFRRRGMRGVRSYVLQVAVQNLHGGTLAIGDAVRHFADGPRGRRRAHPHCPCPPRLRPLSRRQSISVPVICME